MAAIFSRRRWINKICMASMVYSVLSISLSGIWKWFYRILLLTTELISWMMDILLSEVMNLYSFLFPDGQQRPEWITGPCHREHVSQDARPQETGWLPWRCFNHFHSRADLDTTDYSDATKCSTEIDPYTVLKISTICHVRDLWKLALSCKQLWLSCPPDPWNLPGTALLSGFQSSRGAEYLCISLYHQVIIWYFVKQKSSKECSMLKIKINLGIMFSWVIFVL